MYFKSLHAQSKKVWIALFVLGASSIAVSTIMVTHHLDPNQIQTSESAITSAKETSVTTVTALGRLEPQGDITHLSAPVQSQRLAQVLVQEGDTVEVGQVIAISDSLEIRSAMLDEAEARVEFAQARLATVQAGRKSGDISAQNNTVAMVEAEWAGNVATQTVKIESLEAELLSAEVDYQRYQALHEAGAISSTDFDVKNLAVETLEKQLLVEQTTLERIALAGAAQQQAEKNILESLLEVRSVDISEATAQVSEAMALRRKAAAELEQAYVRSPMEGTILELHARAGETVGAQGIADLGQTQQMYAIVEVYETDIRHIQVGQKAILISEYGGFTGELEGSVEHVGLQIGKPGTTTHDPGAAADVRVAEVKIRLVPEDSEKVKHLNKLQVRASIQP